MESPAAAEEAKPAEAAPPAEEAKPAEEAVPTAAACQPNVSSVHTPAAPVEQLKPRKKKPEKKTRTMIFFWLFFFYDLLTMIKKRIIRKIAPAQCDIAETRTAFFLGVKEEKKKRKNGKKKGRQTRHFWRGRKPLEAEKALRKLWETKTKHPTEHACTILAKLIACRHLTSSDFARCKLVQDIQETLKKQGLKPANSERKKQTKNVGGRCHAPKPAAEWQHSLTTSGGSFRALLRGLLLLSCCATPNAWHTPAVKTGPSFFDTTLLPNLARHQLSHQQTFTATMAVPGSMRSASSGSPMPPTPGLECTLEVSFPYVT